MASDTSDFILPLGDPQDEDTSDEVVEVMPESQVANKKKRSAKAKSTNTGNEITTTKSQAKTSWVWNYFIKKRDDKGEMRAYCQFVINDEKCTKSYKHDGSTGNLSSHIIRHGVIPPTEHFVENKSQSTTQPIPIQKHGQKEKEESMLRWILSTTQPLSTVTHKAYIEHMHIIDPEFVVPGEKKLRMMIARSYGYNKEKLTQLLKTAQSISLTTDLWTSRSKHGYLGLTATWINQNFEILDVLLEITYFPAPHTAEAIADVINNSIKKWKIEDRVITITTDNGSNMIAAINKLAPITRLSCVAHTLQLAIGKGLKLVQDLTKHAKQLINFFSTQKQIERLVKAQKDSGYEEGLQPIQDVSTR
jgi:hypothetical protein